MNWHFLRSKFKIKFIFVGFVFLNLLDVFENRFEKTRYGPIEEYLQLKSLTVGKSQTFLSFFSHSFLFLRAAYEG
jgi:hypothetical protein